MRCVKPAARQEGSALERNCLIRAQELLELAPLAQCGAHEPSLDVSVPLKACQR